MLQILRIDGKSMMPEYQPGDFVLVVKRTRFTRRLRAGDTIVFMHSIHGTLIKHVQRVSSAGVYVIGTRENSLDSRRLGPIDPAKIRGRVIWHIRQKKGIKQLQ
jgi:nickel-type superoxide dismutase maturation protease